MLSAADRSVPRKETVELFGVSLATIKRWLKRRRENGDVETPPREASSKIKALLKKEAARTSEALVEAIGRALDAVTPRTLRGGSSTAATRSRLSASKYRLQDGLSAPKVSSSQSNILWLRKPSALGSQ